MNNKAQHTRQIRQISQSPYIVATHNCWLTSFVENDFSCHEIATVDYAHLVEWAFLVK